MLGSILVRAIEMEEERAKQLKAQQLKQQQAMAILQRMQAAIQTNVDVTDICMEKCISRMNRALSGSEQKCLWNCAARYSDSEHYLKNRLLSLGQNDEFSDSGFTDSFSTSS